MTFDIALEDVASIIRRVAEEQVLPRFHHLAQHEIREKSPGNLVTIADTEAERALTSALTNRLPGSLVVGEEAVAEDPSVLDRLAGDQPVWIIDPVDGTINFAKSVPRFAIIVALAAADELRAGWIHDPIRNATAMATAGGGAWRLDATGRHRLRRASMPALRDARGVVGGRFGRGRVQDILERGGQVGPLHRVTCAGLEYVDLVEGRVDFAAFSRILPWDHAAGVLIHREAGGTSGFVEDDIGEPTGYSVRRQAGLLLHAPTSAGWSQLRGALMSG
jgi:fructose-1,6-bisphosphatase/inositol monophosphatase family enzyme